MTDWREWTGPFLTIWRKPIPVCWPGLALRYLGQDQVDDQVLATLRRQIADDDRAAIRKDLRHAPAWIADLLRPLTEPKPSA